MLVQVTGVQVEGTSWVVEGASVVTTAELVLVEQGTLVMDGGG